MRGKRALLVSLILAAGMAVIPVAKSGYYFIRGLIAFKHGFEGESARCLEKSIKANPYFLETHMLLALAYSEWASASLHYIEHDDVGIAKLKSDMLGRTEDVLKNALARFPYHHLRDDMQYMLGRIYDLDSRNTGYVWDKGKAIQNYKELINEYPKSRYVQKAKERIEKLSK